MKEILFIVGSERKDSFNRQIALLASTYLEDKAKVSFLSLKDIPFFNEDFEFPTPKEVEEMREKVKKADGIWIFTPEYNRSYPAIIKNAIDWLSRSIVKNDFSSGTSIMGKKVAISGIGGRNAVAGAIKNLEELLSVVKAVVLEQSEGFAVNPSAFISQKVELQKEDISRLYSEADRLLEEI